jgi:hypothetical protein
MSEKAWDFGPIQKRVFPRDMEAPEHLVIGIGKSAKIAGAVSTFNDLADELINLVELAAYLGISFNLAKYYVEKLGIPTIRRGKSLYLDDSHDPDIRLRMEGPPRGTAALSSIGNAHRLSPKRLREAVNQLGMTPFVTVDDVDYFTPEQQDEIVYRAYSMADEKAKERAERSQIEIAEYKSRTNQAFVAAGYRPRFGKGCDVATPDGCVRCIEASVLLGVSYSSVQGFIRRGTISVVRKEGVNFPQLESVMQLRSRREKEVDA